MQLRDTWEDFYWERLDPVVSWFQRGFRWELTLMSGALLSSVALLQWGVKDSELPPGVRGLHSTVASLGALLFCARAMWKWVDSQYTGHTDPTVFARALIQGSCLLLLVLVGLNLGASFLEPLLVAMGTLSSRHVGVTLGMAACAWVGWRIFRLEPSSPFEVVVLEPSDLDLPALPKRYRTAVHEAGHALFLRCLPPGPEMALILRDEDFNEKDAKGNRQLGVVRALVPQNHAETEDGLRFRMRLALGGLVAERLVFGHATTGGGSDQERWMLYAEYYLLSGFGGAFYDPIQTRGNHQRRRHNQDALHALHAACVKEVSGFLSQNLHVLLALAQHALEKKSLDNAGLAPFLEQVVVAPDWVLVGPLEDGELVRSTASITD